MVCAYRLRDELLNLEQFDSARPARAHLLGRRTTTSIGRTDLWTASPPTSSRDGVLIPLRLLRRLRSISTPTHYLLPKPYSHNVWTGHGGIPHPLNRAENQISPASSGGQAEQP